MMKRFVFIVVSIWFVFAASIASATTIKLAFDKVENYSYVNIYAGDLGNLTTEAGNYILKYQTAPNAFTSLNGYCVDPHYASSSYQEYVVQPIARGSAYAAAAWILSQGYTTIAPQAQVAVWELTWDGMNQFNLNAGVFRLYDKDQTYTDKVKEIYDAALRNSATFESSRYVIVHSPATSGGADYQDYVVRNPNPVPLPPSVLLFGTGLLGMGLIGFRRRLN
jgi:hypothetical protein